MSALILSFPEGGRDNVQHRAPPPRVAGFDYARFGRWLPLRLEDAGHIVTRAASTDPAARHQASELMACVISLRHCKAHPQTAVAAEIVRQVKRSYQINAGPEAA